MADDLADRISDGAVAVLELVPGEQRFADLSRFVLKGGASRFAPVVLDDEPIRYVLPVGVPGHKLDFGTLLIQQTRCALVWRTDPARPYHAMITALGPETTVKQSPATVRGDVWGRFDLRHPGTAHMTFLVPPVASAELPKMLHRVLVVEPQAQRGDFATAPLAPEITEAPRPPEPEVVVHDGPMNTPVEDADAAGLFRAGRRRRATAAEDHTQVLPVVGQDDHTQVLPAVDSQEPTQTFAAFDDTASQRPVDDERTRVLGAVDAPRPSSVPRPASQRQKASSTRGRASRSAVQAPQPVASPTPKSDTLYRSEPRPTPSARPAAQSARAAGSARRDAVATQVVPAATPSGQTITQPEPPRRSFVAEFIPGVLMGLAIVAVLGVLYFAALALGFLG